MANIGIVGWGIVGQATGKAFAKKHKITWHDPYKPDSAPLEEVVRKSKFIFVCVPTPMFSDFSGIDLSIMDGVIKKIASYVKKEKKIVVVKSTVIPGTTSKYAKKYPHISFAMNPEFLTEANAEWDFLNPDRTVIGAQDNKDGKSIAKLYKELYGPGAQIFITDTTSAEMVKYMSNTFLATKVIFANEFFDLANKLKIDYFGVARMVAADKRIGLSHLLVTPERGFGGKCFPKDSVAILGLAKKLKTDLSLVESAWKKNLKVRKVRDWEKINGAVNDKPQKLNGKSRKTDVPLEL